LAGLFVFEFAGFYLAGRSSLEGIGELNDAIRTINVCRQLRQLVAAVPSVAKSGSAHALLNSIREQSRALMRQGLEQSSKIPEAHELFRAAQRSFDHMESSLGAPARNEEQSRARDLIVQQYALESAEFLDKAQIVMTTISDQTVQRIYQARYNALIAGVILSLLFFAFALKEGLRIIRQIDRSVQNLLTATQEMGKGNLSVRAPVLENDEIGKLTHAFNMMAENLEESTVSKQTLAAANKELEAFSYSVSHDLRAPLRAIDGFSLAILEDYQDKLDDAGKDYLIRIRAATQKMARLIEDILKLSRVSRMNMTFEEVNLSDLVREITDDLRKESPERSAEIVIEPNVLTSADPALVRIALENLLGNAWKYTSKRERTRIEFGREKKDGKTVYFVRDNGAGFNMTYANRLFGAFQRLHTESEFPGTGIGLALVQRIFRRHGGEVWAEAEVDKGATFYFTLADEGGVS
jgi:signal transduction histidine kinase